MVLETQIRHGSACSLYVLSLGSGLWVQTAQTDLTEGGQVSVVSSQKGDKKVWVGEWSCTFAKAFWGRTFALKPREDRHKERVHMGTGPWGQNCRRCEGAQRGQV